MSTPILGINFEGDTVNSEFLPLMKKHGIPVEHSILLLTGGANNRVFRVTAGERSWVLKQYFQRDDDPRDRFAAEHDYYTALWDAGIRQIPQPLGWDRDKNLGLFEFISGRKLNPGEITPNRVDEALAFIINSNRCAGATRLNAASEACFSLPQHLATVERRIRRLQSIADQEARDFVGHELIPKWQEIAAKELSYRSEQKDLTDDQKCISPSDFGFHNALLQPDKTLKFFDFEYAGTDDPAKLVCDFFCQPRLPAALDYWDRFTTEFADKCGWDDRFPARALALLPVYQIKWCCIMLNEFLHTDAQRREFSGDVPDLEERKGRQLTQARAALARVSQD